MNENQMRKEADRMMSHGVVMQHLRHTYLMSSDLDGLVHDAASRMATKINNQGLTQQISFLLEIFNVQTLTAELDKLDREKKESYNVGPS